MNTIAMNIFFNKSISFLWYSNSKMNPDYFKTFFCLSNLKIIKNRTLAGFKLEVIFRQFYFITFQIRHKLSLSFTTLLI